MLTTMPAVMPVALATVMEDDDDVTAVERVVVPLVAVPVTMP